MSDQNTLQTALSHCSLVSPEMRDLARAHYVGKGKYLKKEAGVNLIGPWTPKEMQHDAPSGGYRSQRGETCCPRQDPAIYNEHVFWICENCYYANFAANAVNLEFQASFSDRTEGSHTEEMQKAMSHFTGEPCGLETVASTEASDKKY